MLRDIKMIYECASKYGMDPFHFDSKVVKGDRDVFNMDCGRILSLNIKKYKLEAKKILKEYENKEKEYENA